MRWLACMLAVGVVATTTAASAADAGLPLSECADAVGAWLTENPGNEPSRSLIALSADGVVSFEDSGQGGGVGFAPFTSGHGTWRCLSSGADGPKLVATILDFTLPTADWPNQRIGRLDIEAHVDALKPAMSGTMKLMSVPVDGDPLASGLAQDAAGTFDAVRITAP